MLAQPYPAFSLPTKTEMQLEALVDRIQARPGDLIDPRQVMQQQAGLDIRKLLDRLPQGMIEDDLIGIFKLALLTECATESYAATIQECAARYEAGWLGRFNAKVWAPDELTHHTPYKAILMNMGFDEAELDREIKETQEKHYLHYGGATPVHMTTFAMFQEYLTDSWHGLVAKLLKRASPEASEMVMKIKRRETLHCVWYRDMTALQVEANPSFIDLIGEQVEQFHMPGTSLVPELQAQGMRWQTIMGADFELIFRDMFRLVQETLSDVRLTGRLVMRLASAQNIKLGPLAVSRLHAALSRLGSPGYGLVGEAALERVGLGYMFASRDGRQDSGLRFYERPYEQIRALLRSWIAEQLPPPAKAVLRI